MKIRRVDATTGLQEDFLCHATPAALEALQIVENVRSIVAIEFLAAAQSYDRLEPRGGHSKPIPLLRRRTPANHTTMSQPCRSQICERPRNEKPM